MFCESEIEIPFETLVPIATQQGVTRLYSSNSKCHAYCPHRASRDNASISQQLHVNVTCI
jgi:hypothetical protein